MRPVSEPRIIKTCRPATDPTSPQYTGVHKRQATRRRGSIKGRIPSVRFRNCGQSSCQRLRSKQICGILSILSNLDSLADIAPTLPSAPANTPAARRQPGPEPISNVASPRSGRSCAGGHKAPVAMCARSTSWRAARDSAGPSFLRRELPQSPRFALRPRAGGHSESSLCSLWSLCFSFRLSSSRLPQVDTAEQRCYVIRTNTVPRAAVRSRIAKHNLVARFAVPD